MRLSRTQLALKYANRSPHLGGAIFLFIVGLVLAPWFLPTVIRDGRLSVAGVKAQATVKDKVLAEAQWPSLRTAALLAHGGRRGPVHQLRYEFTVGGQVFSGTMIVSREEWEAARIGQTVEVVYLPSEPQVNRASRPFWQTSGALPFGIGIAATIGGMWSIFRGIREVSRKVWLIANGSLAIGLIDEVEMVRGRKGRGQIKCLKYTYQTEECGEKLLRHGQLRWLAPFGTRAVKRGD